MMFNGDFRIYETGHSLCHSSKFVAALELKININFGNLFTGSSYLVFNKGERGTN